MSADAKVWREGDWWRGVHDGDCVAPHTHAMHDQGDYHLSTVLGDIETCMGKLRWIEAVYTPAGTIGFKGYVG